jgi:hypothetical protein
MSEDKSAAPIGDAIKVETSTIETKSIEPTGEAPKGDALKCETPKAAATAAPLVKEELPIIIDAPKLAAEAPKLVAEAPKLAEASKLAEPRATSDVKAIAEGEKVTAAPAPRLASFIPAWFPPSARMNQFALLAGSVALAAIIGGLAGALGASALLRPADTDIIAEAAPMPTIVDETRAMQGSLTQLRSDLATLKTSLDASGKSRTGQVAKITERLERVERAQSEPAAKIGKLAETLERLEKRVDALTAREATGSVTPPQSSGGNASAPPPAIVGGWVLREVYRGTALVQGRFGLIEVETGDIIPGVGRVEAIRKQDGRWVVVTPRGIIAAAR